MRIFNGIASAVIAMTFGIAVQAMPQKISFEKSLHYLLENINRPGTTMGTVVASPSKSEPDYYYHWVRDAGLVMSTVLDVYQKADLPAEYRQRLLSLMYDFVERAKSNQAASGFENLGEPKYNIDGSPFTGPWGRPQNDGPALRAITLIRFANELLDHPGMFDYVKHSLYAAMEPSMVGIKLDLEYVAHKWHQHGVDYWEEVRGHHFSTAMVQRKALLMGADLADKLEDYGAADFYRLQALHLKGLIDRFWSADKKFIQATIEKSGGVYKSELDISVILGVNHGVVGDGFYNVDNHKVTATVRALEETFARLYPVNARYPELGLSIGRYPEDSYNGYRTDRQGHGWFLAVFGMVEYYSNLKKHLLFSGTQLIHSTSGKEFYCYLLQMPKCSIHELQTQKTKKAIIQAIDGKIAGYLARANFHAANDGRMSEQMNRYHGYMQGAHDLTWSYASHISALMSMVY